MLFDEDHDQDFTFLSNSECGPDRDPDHDTGRSTNTDNNPNFPIDIDQDCSRSLLLEHNKYVFVVIFLLG